MNKERIAGTWSAVLWIVSLTLVPVTAAPVRSLLVNVSWGHRSPTANVFHVQCSGQEITVADHAAYDMEDTDTRENGRWTTTAGAGDVDGVTLELSFADIQIRQIENLHSIWAYHIEHSDPDTARRLRADPGYRPDPRRLTVRLDEAGLRGFSVTIDQLLQSKAFWMPELDVFVAAGDAPISFAEHEARLKQQAARRILDMVDSEPEATYEQYKRRWEDMGDPAYTNPHSVRPGHIICVTWDSAVHKFGIDRGAGVWSDLGNPDKHHYWYDFGDPASGIGGFWKSQKLADGLPIVTTALEKEGIGYQVEQFAYPLDGPPQERRGDMPMVLMQKVVVTNLSDTGRNASVLLHHERELPAAAQMEVSRRNDADTLWFEDGPSRKVLLVVRAEDLNVRNVTNERTPPRQRQEKDPGMRTSHVAISFALPAARSREFLVYVPSPPVAWEAGTRLAALSYEKARAETTRFWSDYLAKGAEFRVPEEAVNELFRASLWHALRLPRRHGGSEADVRIDLPYSNFAYGQSGAPWPVNQAIYVDYMLYDLRGYHDLSAEELAVMSRSNQEPNGRIGGYANWGVYTPSMIYAVAKHYLLSQDRASFEALLPQTLKALDWCRTMIRTASERNGPHSGLVRAPLNDLSHDERAWAFNQAYLFAGPDMLARALADIDPPRAAECRTLARAMYDAIQRGYAHASVQSPLVQLRDHTWMPYVPGDALSPRRLLDVWYPTDVDTGPLHMSRLRALDPRGPLTTYLLHDHEDNLFYRQWGMANEPVYNQQASVYLWRDEPKAAIRAFYSMLACAFSHTVFESVEHRWAWGQYFCPPSTDGAWFELYRNMLIQECDEDCLLLLQAAPRKWLEPGKTITVRRAPTYYGRLSMDVESHVTANRIRADIGMPERKYPKVLRVRFRHPAGKPIRAAVVNGQDWTDFDIEKEWVQIRSPSQPRYSIDVLY